MESLFFVRNRFTVIETLSKNIFLILRVKAACQDMGILAPCVQFLIHNPIVSTGEVDTAWTQNISQFEFRFSQESSEKVFFIWTGIAFYFSVIESFSYWRLKQENYSYSSVHKFWWFFLLTLAMEAHLEGMKLYCSHISEPTLMSNFEHNLKFTVLAYTKIRSQFFQESQAV